MLKTRSQTTILVADDEPSMLALVAGYLRSQGYKVVEASDGDQAWEQACEHLPDLVVLDVMMPGMSGWEVCHKVRETVSLAHTGVVMLTGIGERLNEITSPLYEADTYLDKPFEFSALDDKILQTLIARSGASLDSSAKAGPRKTRGANGRSGTNGVVTSVGGARGKTKPAVKSKPKPSTRAKKRPKKAAKKSLPKTQTSPPKKAKKKTSRNERVNKAGLDKAKSSLKKSSKKVKAKPKAKPRIAKKAKKRSTRAKKA